MPRPLPVIPPLPSEVGNRVFCQRLLPLVSRTFAACIRLLPAPVDHQVLVAYLLCRIADTIEDTADLPVPDKEALLALFERALSDPNTDLTPLTQAFAHPRIPDELLTREAHATLAEYYALGPAACTAIRPWVQEMCQGMARYARIHSAAHPGRLVSLTSIEELDSYCYYVAGTVGHLLTELFSLHSPRVTPHHYQRLKALSTSFGLGLQLTNIIKDVADDRQRGWSFVPTQLCSLVGVTPEALLEPEHQRQARIVMDTLISKAKGHLNDALAYCTALPRSQYKIRLFCLTPLYFAVRTLALAERDPRLLDPTHKVKITRGEVYRTLCATYIVAPSNHLTAAYFRQLVGKRR